MAILVFRFHAPKRNEKNGYRKMHFTQKVYNYFNLIQSTKLSNIYSVTFFGVQDTTEFQINAFCYFQQIILNVSN